MKKDRSVLWILIAIVLLVIAVLAAVHYAGAAAGQAPPAVTTLPSNLPKTEKPASNGLSKKTYASIDFERAS